MTYIRNLSALGFVLAVLVSPVLSAMKPKVSAIANEVLPLHFMTDDSYFPVTFPQSALKNTFNRTLNVEPKKGSVSLENGMEVRYEHYKTGKDTLIVFALGKGDGLRDQYRHKPYIIEFLKHYDVVVFDYAWKTSQGVTDMMKLAYQPFITTFKDSHKSVQAVVKEMRTAHEYRKIIGHGECYSAYMFAQAEGLKEGGELFDKLVLDSPIVSARQCAYEMVSNPALNLWPLSANKHPWYEKCCGNYLAAATTAVMRFCSSEYFTTSVLDALGKITIPVLLIRGEHDPMVSDEDFTKAWHALGSAQKAVLKTPCKHSDSFAYKNKIRGRYCYVENAFIKKEFDKFIQTMESRRAKA